MTDTKLLIYAVAMAISAVYGHIFGFPTMNPNEYRVMMSFTAIYILFVVAEDSGGAEGDD